MDVQKPPSAPTDQEKLQFWRSFLLATETEPRPALDLKGASGLSHPVTALGVDETRRRIVVVSGEPNPKAAALAQVDIQAATSGYQVILARPITVNLGVFASAIAAFIGTDVIDIDDLRHLKKSASENDPVLVSIASKLPSVISGRKWAAFAMPAEWQEAIRQLAQISIHFYNPNPGNPDTFQSTMFLKSLLGFDPTEADLALGNCPIPLYEFEPEDAEVFHRGVDVEAIREVLRQRHLLQYFFPAPDQLALGVAEDGARRIALSRAVSQAPASGHPFGSFELLPGTTKFEELIDTLTERNLLVEGEFGHELTEGARTIRAQIRFKPREGLLKKLSRVLSLKIDIDPASFLK